MSPSTFWRRPDEKKLDGAAIDWAATAGELAGAERMMSEVCRAGRRILMVRQTRSLRWHSWLASRSSFSSQT